MTERTQVDLRERTQRAAYDWQRDHTRWVMESMGVTPDPIVLALKNECWALYKEIKRLRASKNRMRRHFRETRKEMARLVSEKET